MDSQHRTLGNNVIPVNYNLTIDTNFKTFKFNGNIKIKLKFKKKLNKFKINTHELKVKKISVSHGATVQKAEFSHDDVNQELMISFATPIFGDATVEIDYEGINNDKLYGFYRSKYLYKGKTEYILSSQFEAPDARSAFPCFDEPAFKATFDLTLIVDKKHDALSNMPVKSTSKVARGRKAISFKTTPIMSTYLLYMGVGQYEYVETNLRNIKIRVVTVPGKKELAKLPLKYTKLLLAELERYYGIKYMNPKLDMIAIPDFAAGAMENWGAITFRESAILGDEKNTPVAYKQHIAEVIAHELAHQWFGDLVTMQWWDDMWLNESFANLLEYKIVDKIFPEWLTLLKYYVVEISRAMSADEVNDTHPISVKVENVNQIDTLFDAIGYAKGGGVLYMLEDFVGKEVFRKGLNRYLREHSYSNANKVDLWNAIEKEARIAGKKLPIPKIMSEWVTKTGYPIINVINDGKFELTQSRFTLSGKSYNSLWPIPVHYITDKSEGRILFNGKRWTMPDNAKWIKLNYGQAGFYRTNYDVENLYKLGKLIQTKKLKAADAWGIENDLFILVRRGSVPVSIYLDFIERYCMEPDYPLSFTLSGHLNGLISLAYNEKFVDGIKAVSNKYHKAILEKLGWSQRRGERSIDTKLRANAIASLGYTQDPRALRWAKKQYQKGYKKIDPNMKSAVLSIVAFNNGTPKMFSKFLKMYNTEKMPADKENAVGSLGSFGDIKLLKKALDINFKKIRIQDSVDIPISVMSNPNGGELLSIWIAKNWPRLMKIYPISMKMLELYVKMLANVTKDEAGRARFMKIFSNKKHMREDLVKEVPKMLEKIDATLKFLETNR